MIPSSSPTPPHAPHNIHMGTKLSPVPPLAFQFHNDWYCPGCDVILTSNEVVLDGDLLENEITTKLLSFFVGKDSAARHRCMKCACLVVRPVEDDEDR
jgi:hypothetical protein